MIKLNLRLPPALHKKLTKLAAKEHRSLNSQIITMLEESINAGPKEGT